MLPGYHTQNLVSEIYRLTENVSKQGEETRPAAFDWLDKYKSSGKLPSYVLLGINNNIEKYLWLPLSCVDKQDKSVSS